MGSAMRYNNGNHNDNNGNHNSSTSGTGAACAAAPPSLNGAWFSMAGRGDAPYLPTGRITPMLRRSIIFQERLPMFRSGADGRLASSKMEKFNEIVGPRRIRCFEPWYRRRIRTGFAARLFAAELWFGMVEVGAA
jgi:hypothetical protein